MLVISRVGSRAALGGVALLAIAAVEGCRAPTPAPVPAPPRPADSPPATSRDPITAEELRRDLLAFADDSMMGRETGTPSVNKAAAFLASRLMSLGLEPAGDSLYLQRVPLVRQRFSTATRLEVMVGASRLPLRLGDDVAPLLSLGEGLPEPRRRAEGELVFAGYGIQRPGRDDLAGLDLAGKVVVVIHGAPPGITGPSKDSMDAQPEMSQKLGRLLPRNPAAIIVLMNEGTANFYRQLLPNLVRDVKPAGAHEAGSDAQRTLPMIVFGVARAGSPLLPARWPADDKPQPLREKRFSATLDVRGEPFTAYNVVGIVRGSDARMNRTFVAMGAHYDHIGTLPPLNGDSIANGADDDGSGSVALLAVARAFKANPGRRSTLFVWHVGEEKGLLGSSFFTERPTVPIDSIVAQINADMIGRNGRDSLFLVGPRAAPNNQSRRLGQIADSVNAAAASPFTFNRTWDDPGHPEQIYQRSDHFNYAKKGIPILFFTSGLHPEYHSVDDEVPLIDFVKLTKVSILIEETGRAVANSDRRPR
jgi:hypothetical protein